MLRWNRLSLKRCSKSTSLFTRWTFWSLRRLLWICSKISRCCGKNFSLCWHARGTEQLLEHHGTCWKSLCRTNDVGFWKAQGLAALPNVVPPVAWICFAIKFSTFSRLFIRKLGLYSWICTGELLQKQQFLDLLGAHAAGLTEEFSTTFFVWMLTVLHSASWLVVGELVRTFQLSHTQWLQVQIYIAHGMDTPP